MSTLVLFHGQEFLEYHITPLIVLLHNNVKSGHSIVFLLRSPFGLVTTVLLLYPVTPDPANLYEFVELLVSLKVNVSLQP